MKLIGKCCVCGTIIHVTTYIDGTNREKISHGFCGMCEHHKEIQLLVWNDDYDLFVPDRGFEVENRVYYRESLLESFVVIGTFPCTGHLCVWNDSLHYYEIVESKTFSDTKDVKAWARHHNVNIRA